MSSGIRASMPAQARTTCTPRMIGNRSCTVRALTASSPKSSTVSLRSGYAVPCNPPPIITVPLSNCLNDSVRPAAPTTGSMKCGTLSVIISIGATAFSGTGSPSAAASSPAQAPAALTTAGAW